MDAFERKVLNALEYLKKEGKIISKQDECKETTVEYYIEKSLKGENAIINDGKVIGFQQEEIPTQTANQSGDK